MHLYYYPPEDTFIGRGAFGAFESSKEWSSFEALPTSRVNPKNKPPGGDGDAPDWSKETTRSLTPINLYSVSDVYFFPWSGVLLSSDGGVFRYPAGETSSMARDLTFLPFCQSDGLRTSFLPPADLPFIDELAVTVPFGGGSGGNYGHFLLDALPAACLMERLNLLTSRVLGVPELRSWQLRHFEILGLNPTTLTEYVYKVGRAVYSSSMDHNLLRPNMNYLDVRRQGLINHKRSGKPWPKRIYLSRGAIASRVNRTEEELQVTLKKMDFAIIDPSAHCVDEQIELFSNADVVVGCTGAAFANAIYCAPKSVVCEIQPTGMHYAWVQDICAIVGCNYAPFFVKGEITSEEKSAHVGSEFAVNAPNFSKYLKEAMV